MERIQASKNKDGDTELYRLVLFSVGRGSDTIPNHVDGFQDSGIRNH